MNSDPYQVLEIPHNASNDEVKRAYRELSRKYHPDSYINNPLSDLAEEKFKEVQEAYKQIMQEREHGNYQNSYSSNNQGYSQSGYGNNQSYNYNQNYGGNNPAEMAQVTSFLNAGRYRDALNILTRLSVRDAQWYYYSSVANAGMGNNFIAIDHARTAMNMEPSNQEYRAFYNRLQNANHSYQNVGRHYGRGNSDDTCDMCMKLWCADSICECMGGDLIPCI